MKHTIDTKAIQELAAMSPEAKVYLERVFPEAFKLGYYKDKNQNSLLISTEPESMLKNYGWHPANVEEIQRFIPYYKPE